MSTSLPALDRALAVASLPDGARLLLWVVIGLLVVTLAILVALALMMRRRTRAARERERERGKSLAEDIGEVLFDDGESIDERGVDDVICPQCLQSFDADLLYCPRDGRKLVLGSEIDEVEGRVCPVCSLGFTESHCFCPHDGAALIVADPRRARRLATVPAGALGKICPRCRARHEFTYTFCTRDGSELRILN